MKSEKKQKYKDKDRSLEKEPVFSVTKDEIRESLRWIGYNGLWSFLLIIVIEMLARHSVAEGIGFVWNHPFLTLYSMLLLTFLYSMTLLFAKRRFVWLLTSTVIIGLAIANYVLLFFRITPLAATDFGLLTSVFSIMDIYLQKWQIVLVIALVIATMICIVWMGIKMKRQTYRPLVGLLLSVMLFGVIFFVTSVGDATSLLCTSFASLPEAYRQNGFVYCFTRSLVDRGISKPSQYSEESVDDILKSIKSTKTNKAEVCPNIIFLQLESFIDLRRMKNVTYSEPPQPIFASLRDSEQGGFLTVPSVGAGTANTEFEIMSGMDLSYFGVGEYPYKTVLQDKTCESMAYNLKENQYHATAIHNNKGDFYDRNAVFANLGFDRFVSIEYMKNVSFNEIGWAKDNVLTQNIMDTLYTTEKQDLIYAISVQDHGKYPSQPVGPSHIKVDGFAPDDEERQCAYEYYVNQCHETDAFLGYLITALNAFEEPVILIIYGDHLPNLEMTEEELLVGNLFQTEYVIWTNRALDCVRPIAKKSKNLYAYQLSAYVLDLLGMNNGVLTKFHQKYMDVANYNQELETLQYDMLYGKQETFGGTAGYESSDMKMGILPITISQVSSVGGSIYVQGENFTPYSVVYRNDKRLETQFLNESMLMVSDELAQEGDAFTVAQTTEIYEKLSETDVFTYHE